MSRPARKPQFLAYRTARFLTRIFLRIWERFESQGSQNVPATGGCIIATNHVSFLDPPAVCCGLQHRYVRFMARDTLFTSTRIGGWFFHSVQCIPIDRTRGDVSALRRSIQVLRQGDVLAVFPEGTRSADGELKAAKGGVGFLIAKAGVPVVPAYVDGSFKAFPKGARFIKPGRVRIFYGPPIPVAEFAKLGQSRDAYEKIGQMLMAGIAALKPKPQ
jgi:1-acyl-sn-glycerol-3-phosphate acyltransferase